MSSGYGFSRRRALDEVAIQSAHSGFVPQSWWPCNIHQYFSTYTPSVFGFIPLSVVFNFNPTELTVLILSAAPAFSLGLAEDIGYAMSSRTRLFASVVSSSLAILFLKVWLTRLGCGTRCPAFICSFGILFTIFAAVGVVNAFNLIDGLNGLSSFVAISVALSLSIIAFNTGNTQIMIFLILIIASVIGFMILNFPMGWIFLGDGGAYALGHLLVWSAIILSNSSLDVSPFAILLIFFWPVADTGLAIWRRWKLGNPTDHPDRLHFHQLVMRALEIRFFGRMKVQIPSLPNISSDDFNATNLVFVLE